MDASLNQQPASTFRLRPQVKARQMKIVLAAVLAGAVVATTNSQAVGELRGLQTSNTCKVYIAAGGACSEDGSCVATAYCSSTTSKCVTLPVAGAKCGNDIFCAAGLACTAYSGGVCSALPKAGQDCLYGHSGVWTKSCSASRRGRAGSCPPDAVRGWRASLPL